MIDEILKDMNYKYVRFIKPPAADHCVYFCDKESGGSDFDNLIVRKTYSVEVYTIKAESEIIELIEERLNARSIEFSKNDTQWLEEMQMYLTIYIFEEIERRL